MDYWYRFRLKRLASNYLTKHIPSVPIVFFDRIVNEINTHKVIADNFKGAYEATKHLIDTGCKTIAALFNVAYLSITKERIAGYKAALQDAGIAVNEDLIHFGEAGKMSEEEIENMLSLSPKTRPMLFWDYLIN